MLSMEVTANYNTVGQPQVEEPAILYFLAIMQVKQGRCVRTYLITQMIFGGRLEHIAYIQIQPPVVPPRTADATRLFDDKKIGDSGTRECDTSADATGSGTDHQNCRHIGTCTGWVRFIHGS